MGIHVKIRRLASEGTVGDYLVYGSEMKERDFYMRVDRESNNIFFYTTSTFSNPVVSIDFNNPEAVIGSVPDVSMFVYSKALSSGIKALKMDDWPEILDYCA